MIQTGKVRTTSASVMIDGTQQMVDIEWMWRPFGNPLICVILNGLERVYLWDLDVDDQKKIWVSVMNAAADLPIETLINEYVKKFEPVKKRAV